MFGIDEVALRKWENGIRFVLNRVSLFLWTTWIGSFGELTIDKSYCIVGNSTVVPWVVIRSNKMKIHLKNLNNVCFFVSLLFRCVFHPQRTNKKQKCIWSCDSISNNSFSTIKSFRWRFRYFTLLNTVNFYTFYAHGEQWNSFGRHCFVVVFFVIVLVVVWIKQIETKKNWMYITRVWIRKWKRTKWRERKKQERM